MLLATSFLRLRTGLYEVCVEHVTMDQRKPLQALKEQVCLLLAVQESAISLHRPGTKLNISLEGGEDNSCVRIMGSTYTAVAGPEIKDLTVSVADSGIVERGGLQIVRRRPLLPHEYRISLFLQMPGAEDGCILSEDFYRRVNTKLPAANVELRPFETPVAGGTEENAPLTVQLLTEDFVVRKDDIVSSLKGIIYHQFVWSILNEEAKMLFPASLPIASIPLRLRVGAKTAVDANSAVAESSSYPTKLAAPLRDRSTLVESMKPTVLSDNVSVVVQVGPECVGEISEAHILVTLIQWNCSDNSLGRPLEITLSKLMSFKELCGLIIYNYLDKAQFDGVSAVDGELLLLAKPFGWQLKDPKTNIPQLKWAQQPKSEDILGQAPWRLQSNSIVVFLPALQYQNSIYKAADANSGDCVSRVHFDASPEVGFRIYSLQEQIHRTEEETKLNEERKASVASKMEALTQSMASGRK
jgi:hypothetical protein